MGKSSIKKKNGHVNLPFCANPIAVKNNWLQPKVQANMSGYNEVSHGDRQPWRHYPLSNLCPTVTLISSFVSKGFPSQSPKQVQTLTMYLEGLKPFKSTPLQDFFSFTSGAFLMAGGGDGAVETGVAVVQVCCRSGSIGRMLHSNDPT